jgi:hypothetical protein
VENFVDNPAEALAYPPAAALPERTGHMTEILIFLYFKELTRLFASFDGEPSGEPRRFSMDGILCISQEEWRDFDIF